MSKFIHCHPADGMMWCQHPNGSWAPPFPIGEGGTKKAETPSQEEVSTKQEEEKDLTV